MSGNSNSNRLTFIANTETLSQSSKPQTQTINLCRSLVAILLDSEAKKEQISHLKNCIKGFVYKKNEEKQGLITGVLLHQKNVFVLFLETPYEAQMELIRDQLVLLKKEPDSGILNLKLLVFNELFKNRYFTIFIFYF